MLETATKAKTVKELASIVDNVIGRQNNLLEQLSTDTEGGVVQFQVVPFRGHLVLFVLTTDGQVLSTETPDYVPQGQWYKYNLSSDL